MRRQCSEFRCDNEHYARGLCRAHYLQSARGGTHRTKPAPRHSIHILALDIERCLDKEEIDFLSVALAAQEIQRICQNNLPAMPTPEKLKELRARFLVESLEVAPQTEQVAERKI